MKRITLGMAITIGLAATAGCQQQPAAPAANADYQKVLIERLLEKHLVDEKRLRDYLAAFQACGQSLIRCYVVSLEEASLWSAPRGSL